MAAAGSGQWISLKNILYLTDFSGPSEAALPFAIAIARGYGATVYGLHVLMPPPYVHAAPPLTAASLEAEEESANNAMQRLQSQLAGLAYETTMERGVPVWAAVERAIRDHHIDLIVLGTHGRTGAEKLLLGSVAEEIFRRSPVPVLTIGPGVRSGAHGGGRFHRVLLASDFNAASIAAAPFAVSLARENQARLILMHVMRRPEKRPDGDENRPELSVAEAIHQLYETVPQEAGLPNPPEIAVEFGDPSVRIVDAARQRGADLIVLGVRGATGPLGATIQVVRATAHKVVARAACPVLTVRF